VKVGRLQIFNNWSPYLVKDSSKIWIGMEYFVTEGDELWNKNDKEMIEMGINELSLIGIIDKKNVTDSTVIRIKKTYPAYFGTYKDFDKIKEFTDSIDNLFLLGRNGQHRYNNQDHSMLTAITAVENIASGRKDKNNIWNINAEKEYHESKN
jgi:protoporphyrinogen oxidase